MDTTGTEHTEAADHSDEQQLQHENEQLRARVVALESELVEVQARANSAVAEWQERAYWLDRWHVDLNALMRKPGAAQFRGALRAVRSVAWRYKRIKRRLKRP
jgi:uncharacterized protein YlxW (UPF0749 family)